MPWFTEYASPIDGHWCPMTSANKPETTIANGVRRLKKGDTQGPRISQEPKMILSVDEHRSLKELHSIYGSQQHERN